MKLRDLLTLKHLKKQRKKESKPHKKLDWAILLNVPFFIKRFRQATNLSICIKEKIRKLCYSKVNLFFYFFTLTLSIVSGE